MIQPPSFRSLITVVHERPSNIIQALLDEYQSMLDLQLQDQKLIEVMQLTYEKKNYSKSRNNEILSTMRTIKESITVRSEKLRSIDATIFNCFIRTIQESKIA